MPVGAGIAVGTVGAGILSARAAEKAGDTAAEGAERSGAQIQAAGDLARRDVQRIFPQAQGDLISGAAGAADILSQGVTEQQRLLSAGNVGAQQTLGQGFGNIQAALLGTPINQQAFAPQGVPSAPTPQGSPLSQPVPPQGLSQPIANPFGQALGGGQVEGGLFSNVGENVQKNIAAEEVQVRTDNLVQLATGAQSAKSLEAKQSLLNKGLNFRGQPMNSRWIQTQQGKLVDELVLGAKGGNTRDALFAKQALVDKGLNWRGQKASGSVLKSRQREITKFMGQL